MTNAFGQNSVSEARANSIAERLLWIKREREQLQMTVRFWPNTWGNKVAIY
jgi:hypothetical protein